MNRHTPIGVAIELLTKEIAERKTAIAILEAVVAGGVSPSAPVADSGRVPGRRGVKTVAAATVEILKEAGRPMHGLREILPLLEGQGLRVKNLATNLMRSGRFVRTAPGTFALAGGGAS